MADHLVFVGGNGNRIYSDSLTRLHSVRGGATTLADKFGTAQGILGVLLFCTTQF